MQKILSKKEFLKGNYLGQIKKGAIFVYPTDTLYGLGCDATNERAVEKIRIIKGRESRPFSVIAPSKEWILETCFIKEGHKKFLKKIPGKFTLILKLKNEKAIAKNVSRETIGIRIPKNWFSDIVKEINRPIVTTSVNLSGEQFMTSLEDIDKNILGKINFVIYEGKKNAKPSTIIKLINEPEIIKR